jgi:hypothetical protein
MVQIDPNGLCNSGCWFCPVAYSPNPTSARKNMPLDTLEGILKQLSEGKGDFVDPSFDFIYTAHYNEVLLYDNFEGLLELFRKYKFKTIVLTNGIALKEDKVDIIKNYLDVVYGICLNIPAAEAELWSKLVNMNAKLFPKVLSNIGYAVEQIPSLFENKNLSIQVNGVNKEFLYKNGGTINLLENAPLNDEDVSGNYWDEQVAKFAELFPGINVYKGGLIDRAGHLDTFKAMTNINAIRDVSDGKKVVGCSNMGSRTEDWIHINANGDLFLCCNDYDFDSVYGNINEKSIKELWESVDRRAAIDKSYSSLCTTCSAAIWG